MSEERPMMTDTTPAAVTPTNGAESDDLRGIESLPGDEKPSRKLEKQMRRYFWTVFGFSVITNLLFLISPMYMLQVYDRVMSSGSYETLIVLSIIAVFLLLIYIAADGGRRRTLTRAGQYMGQALDGLTLRRGLASASTTSTETVNAVGNLSRLQTLMMQGALAPLFDIPFVVFFLGILWLIHPVLGAFGTIGAGMLLVLAVVTDKMSRESVQEAGKRDQRAQNHLSHLVRQRAAIVSMGMSDRAVGHWQKLRRDAADGNVESMAKSTYMSASTRSLRQILQVGILGTGAALAVSGQVTPGTIIAGSIIMGRGLAPIDQTVAIWRQVIMAGRSWKELKEWIDSSAEGSVPLEHDTVTAMPRPEPVLKFEEFSVGVPGADKPLLPQMSLDFEPGTIVALLGPSGSGKTSFLQSCAGAWPAHHGSARLGGRDIATWDARDRGRYVGYLPQHVELLTGTVFENISRFTDPDPEEVFTAARRIGAHDMILTLPKGYDTPIGEGGVHLSAGQRQIVGLARAMFAEPALLLLDEPTAHLDANLAAELMKFFGDLARAPQSDRPLTAIIATHDLRLINAADKVMIIKDRKIAVSNREDYLRKVSDLRRGQPGAQPAQKPRPAAGQVGQITLDRGVTEDKS
ncbi:type I secretion system permease/ATPase [Parvularcula marina]|uniref:ATP-binding cassette domain-containing protein n=1 Tax=Parvularcula marina TaxID=2292771 RepID=A0A371RKH3_9PROT|nr:ATP-binding cassette domain-containing protein [Parvularcula marina]RFB05948.1 ATP-binding cassette domain-containing protein [Parvularcula marina]